MSGNALTPEHIKLQHAAAVAKFNTFEPKGINRQAAVDYLKTDEGALYWWRVAEADPSAPSGEIDRRAINQLSSGRELPRMETLEPHEALAKFVPEHSSPTGHSPFWARQSEAEAAMAAGKNISDFYALPIGSEAPRYSMYRITPRVPTQVFANTVAPTSELGGLVTKHGGAEQYLVPNRKLFHEPVYVKFVDNVPHIAANLEHGGFSNGLSHGAIMGAVAVAYDATTTAARSSDLMHDGNATGAQSQVLHFGGRNLGAWGGAVLGAQVAGTVGAETVLFDVLIAGAGGVVGAVGGDQLADAYDNYRIYHQDDPQGHAWRYDPQQPRRGWTRTITDAFAERGLSHEHIEVAPPALADRLTYQASNVAVGLAMAHPSTPRDPYTQPAGPQDTRSLRDAPWIRDAATHQWSRSVLDQRMEHGLTRTHTETAGPQRATQLEAAAQQTLAGNLACTKRGMAQRYRTVYEQAGWERHGAMPAEVTSALKAPGNALQASNGHVYTLTPGGQWLTPGRLWGTNAAEGNLRAELDATARLATQPEAVPATDRTVPLHTVEASAQPQPPATAEHAVPRRIGPPSIAQTPGARRPIPSHLLDFRHPGHPIHQRYTEALGAVHEMETRARVPHGSHSERVAAALAYTVHTGNIGKAPDERMLGISSVALRGEPPQQVVASAKTPARGNYVAAARELAIAIEPALATSVEQASEWWSRRVMPHLHEPAAPANDTAAIGDPAGLRRHDPRRPDHPQHDRYRERRAQVGALYADAGIARTEAQLEHATAAVMLVARAERMDEGNGMKLWLSESRQGVIGPHSAIGMESKGFSSGYVASATAQDMQRTPEQNFEQLHLVTQQQQAQQVQRPMQRTAQLQEMAR